MTTRTTPLFASPAVAAVFAAYPETVRHKLLALRELIFATAAETDGVGAIEETLKWGQPSYLTTSSRSGSTIRIDRVRASDRIALYCHCQTNLISSFRELYPHLEYQDDRALFIDRDPRTEEGALRHCIALALTYHLRKKSQRR